jgi:hypothetical protein
MKGAELNDEQRTIVNAAAEGFRRNPGKASAYTFVVLCEMVVEMRARLEALEKERGDVALCDWVVELRARIEAIEAKDADAATSVVDMLENLCRAFEGVIRRVEILESRSRGN